MKIIILPPFYKTWWFRFSMILIVLLVLFLIYYIRVIQIQKVNEFLQKTVDERTQELKQKNEILETQSEILKETNILLKERQDEIEKKNKILTKQTNELNETNTLLEERQMQIEEQSEELIVQKEELEKQRDSLKELNMTKDKLFSILGHDLRSPFNTIIGYSELLQKNLRKYPIEKIEIQVGIIREAARNTFHLLINLLEWSRTQRGIIRLEPEHILISELIESELRVLEQQAERKELKISLNTIGKETDVEADSNLLASVMRNLISNAIKFSNKGSTIEITLNYKNDLFSFSVRDHGVGMSSESLEKLFEFNTNDSVRGTAGEKGTGLGLIICKDFIEKHNGRIWAESDLGKGSTFSFEIPVRIM